MNQYQFEQITRVMEKHYGKITQLLVKYLAGQVRYDFVIDRIKWKTVDCDQYCFKTQDALDALTRTGEREIWK